MDPRISQLARPKARFDPSQIRLRPTNKENS
jgi:hypothetical protein